MPLLNDWGGVLEWRSWPTEKFWPDWFSIFILKIESKKWCQKYISYFFLFIFKIFYYFFKTKKVILIFNIFINKKIYFTITTNIVFTITILSHHRDNHYLHHIMKISKFIDEFLVMKYKFSYQSLVFSNENKKWSFNDEIRLHHHIYIFCDNFSLSPTRNPPHVDQSSLPTDIESRFARSKSAPFSQLDLHKRLSIIEILS